ncbi:MAG TPA: PEP-CTERM sorting domain-containing protein [Kiritimatiellia bacterium]|nr:PEP-CTERM sorting domain-containing protein [Kiritimatiellia bacterium]HRZ13104.1 PEP-CTERM sorting domain-containing protein [Kiritimatiellia bacterium]HSA17525.1 PEP-CTERM sorting domain-containing protein [Kiritimatiellia bacterium]
MKKVLFLASLVAAASVQASIIVNDSLSEVFVSANGTMDIVSMEVSHTASDLIFTLAVNGDVTNPDWGNFMIGIANMKDAGSTTGNGWNRPINLDAGSGYGMTHWLGSWVNSGGGAQLWTYSVGAGGGTGGNWSGPAALAAYSFVSGPTSTVTMTVTRSSLGLTGNDTFYFDAYSSGGGGTDSAVDALSNPNQTISDWPNPYTSSGTTGLSTYTIPEPSTAMLMGVGALVGLGVFRRIRRA